MTDIVAFLRARLDEDEHLARSVEHAVGADYDPFMAKISKVLGHLGVVSLYYRRHDPARVLREVKAKRAIVWQWEQAAQRNRDDECDEAAGSAWATLSNTLVLLAGVHDSHPDYVGDNVEDWTWPDDDPAWRADAC